MANDKKFQKYLKLVRTVYANNIFNSAEKNQTYLEQIVTDEFKILTPQIKQVVGTALAKEENSELIQRIEDLNNALTRFKYPEQEYFMTLRGDIINAFLKASGAHMHELFAIQKMLITDGKKKTSVIDANTLIPEEQIENQNEEIPDDEMELD